MGPWCPLYVHTIFSGGVFALRLHETTRPCSVPTMNLVGLCNQKQRMFKISTSISTSEPKTKSFSYHSGLKLQRDCTKGIINVPLFTRVQYESLSGLTHLPNVPPQDLGSDARVPFISDDFISIQCKSQGNIVWFISLFLDFCVIAHRPGHL